MIIDFHVHCFPDELALKAVPALAERAGIKNRLNGTIDNLKESMKKSGVDKSVLLSIATKPSQTQKINSWSAQIQSDEIVAFGSIHPDFSDWKQELKRIKALGLKGIKFHPEYQDFYVDDERMYPIYELALSLNLIIVFHAGVDLGFQAPFHCTPDRLLKVIKAVPGGKIIAAHLGGFSYWEEVEKYLVGEDIYLDTSYTLGVIEELQLKRIFKNHGYEKILFATDSPWKDQKEEVEKINNLGLDEEDKKNILSRNAELLLRI
jgi:uncharacterized protein